MATEGVSDFTPLTGWTTGNYSWTRHHQRKSQDTGMRLRRPLHQRPRQTTLEGVRGPAPHWPAPGWGSARFPSSEAMMDRDRRLLLQEKSEKWSRSVVSDSLWPPELGPTRILRPWHFPGQSTGVGRHFLLQGIFLTQGANPGLLHCRQLLYHLSHQGSGDLP